MTPEFQKQWMEQPGPTPLRLDQLIKECRRQDRNRTLTVWLEVAFGLACLAGSAYFAFMRDRYVVFVWAASIWIFTLIAWAGSAWSRRIVSQAMAATAAEFLNICRGSVGATLRAIRFGLWLLCAEVVFNALLFAWFVRTDWAGLSARPVNTAMRWGIVVIASAGAFVWLWFVKKQKVRELELFDQLHKDHQDTE